MEVVLVDGHRLAITRAGDGPALVLLGGFVSDGLVTWGSQIEVLADSYTVVAWDTSAASRRRTSSQPSCSPS